MESISVPFATQYTAVADLDFLKQLEDDAAGLAIVIGSMNATVQVRGFVRLENNHVVLEFREKATMVTKTDVTELEAQVRTVPIPLTAVNSIHVNRDLLMRPRLTIELNRMDVLPALRWSDGTRMVLPLARRDHERARELSVSVMNRIADQALARLSDD
jgi:hypothetical protein